MKSSSLVLALLLLPLLAFVTGTEDDSCQQMYVGDQCGLMQADEVKFLPGQPEGEDSEDFKQFAGYVTVDPDAGRALFYYFTEATEDSVPTPLLLWFNGGGHWEAHSSLGRGAMMGQGPFRVNSDGETLSLNKYAWNKVANIIFLESPVGVGYSYSNTTSDYDHIGDTKAVEDSYTFLVNWLERFPQYKSTDFYIAGDGYAGHCVPQLAQKILLNNDKCNQTFINLKGIAIGNGWLDEEIFLKGVYDYDWMHNLISNEIHEGITVKCNFSFPIILSPSCLKYMNEAAEMMANINPYDIYGPPCKSSSKNNISGCNGKFLGRHPPRVFEYRVPSQGAYEVGGFDSCSHLYVESYLNLPTVQDALHANITALPYPWTVNSSVIKVWKNWYPSISPIIKGLMGNGTRVWLYSGDTDGVVPITSTKYFIDNFQLPMQISSYPWYAEGEVAGFAVGYENLTFVSVRGGGHFVPSYQPARALTLFSSFIEGKLPPNSPN